MTSKYLLERLTAAEGLERYLQSRYPGTKRFGLEGGESLVPCVDELIQRAGSHGAKEVVIGMAHRGRLNLLVNTLGKNPQDLFDEFDGKTTLTITVMSNITRDSARMSLRLEASTPCHDVQSIASGNRVAGGRGSVRARQDRRSDLSGDRVVPISIHGDAAFAGQGVVMETFRCLRPARTRLVARFT